MKINVNTGIEETSGEIIALRDFANLLKLKIIYMNTARQITLQTVSVNRPGLILSGFDDYFARSRVQVLGNAEMYYLYQMTDENRRAALKINVNTGIEETSGEIIALRDFANLLKLKIIYMNTARQITLQTVSVNRPGLILSGFDDYFARSRVQVLGNAEMYYLYQMTDENRRAALKKLFKTEVPCIIISRGLEPCKDMLDLAKEYDTPVLQSNAITSEVVNDIINFLNDFLAPKTRIHGTLLDIDGIGVLLTGISGVGKSETALELIHRGHMLVADDAVELKVIKDTIQGSSPDKIQDFIELRGVGFINVRNMYGVAGILRKTNVDLVIELVEYEKSQNYERSDAPMRTYNVLGVEIPKLIVPVIMGRNLAIIVEVAAKNFRLKQMGYDANEELIERMNRD